jgi:hypothetical protein
LTAAESKTPNIGVNYYKNYSQTLSQRITKALNAKSDWVTGPPADDKHAFACALKLFQATSEYIDALNSIANNVKPASNCGPKRGDGGDGEIGLDAVDLITYVNILSNAENIATVDEEDTQAPAATTAPDANGNAPNSS